MPSEYWTKISPVIRPPLEYQTSKNSLFRCFQLFVIQIPLYLNGKSLLVAKCLVFKPLSEYQSKIRSFRSHFGPGHWTIQHLNTGLEKVLCSNVSSNRACGHWIATIFKYNIFCSCRPRWPSGLSRQKLRLWRRSRVRIPVSPSFLREKCPEEKSREKVEQDRERA